MNVSLTPELEEMIENKVKSGRYNTASEVVREGLRLLEQQDELRELRRDELRKEIMKGVEQIRNGEFTILEKPEDYKMMSERIKAKGRARRAKKDSAK
jgi:antitoxin ParD1/3/4